MFGCDTEVAGVTHKRVDVRIPIPKTCFTGHFGLGDELGVFEEVDTKGLTSFLVVCPLEYQVIIGLFYI